MQSKIALIQFDKCMPEKCEGGVCIAAKACTHKLIIQEAPGEIPMMNPSLCRGCGDCVRTCPLKAIKIATN
jgi:translation initiation factor RLI1